VDTGKTLIFANTKGSCAELEKDLTASFRGQDMPMLALHGDKQQSERADILKQFKAGARHTLVATDVASRGLDIADIATVINFDCAKSIETHVHRIGRTGRLNKRRGTAAVRL
jgi:superfamily II DNA/RNA helicase